MISKIGRGTDPSQDYPGLSECVSKTSELSMQIWWKEANSNLFLGQDVTYQQLCVFFYVNIDPSPESRIQYYELIKMHMWASKPVNFSPNGWMLGVSILKQCAGAGSSYHISLCLQRLSSEIFLLNRKSAISSKRSIHVHFIGALDNAVIASKAQNMRLFPFVSRPDRNIDTLSRTIPYLETGSVLSKHLSRASNPPCS